MNRPLALTISGAILLAAAGLAAAPVPKEDDAARLRRLYGTPAVPDKDCTIELKGDALRIALPATERLIDHDGGVNAPYTWQEVKGDFTASVRVAFPIRATVPPGDRRARSAAGILAMAGGEVICASRNELTYPKPIPKPQCEDFHLSIRSPQGNGNGSAVDKQGIGEAAYLRLTRAGKVVTGHWSRDGKKWHSFDPEYRVGWGETVRVGVFAENSYEEPFAATLDQFTLARAAK